MVTSVNDWVVIQQRVDGSTNFRLPWLDYTNGFGKFNRNFWLGLERMYRITTSNAYRLRLEFRLLNGTWLSAEYDSFFLDDEDANYTLHVSGFSGDGGDWLNPNDPIRSQNGMQFSTYDADHDTAPNMSCADSIYGGGGGFWYNSCSWIKPHAVYGTPQFSIVSDRYKLSISTLGHSHDDEGRLRVSSCTMLVASSIRASEAIYAYLILNFQVQTPISPDIIHIYQVTALISELLWICS